MEERKIIFEVYDEIDKIAYKLNGIYQTLYSMDLEILTSFVDNQGRASKAFLCDQLSHNISKLIEYNEKLLKFCTNLYLRYLMILKMQNSQTIRLFCIRS